MDKGHKQGKVPVAEQKMTCQGTSNEMHTLQSKGRVQARGSMVCTTGDGVSECTGEHHFMQTKCSMVYTASEVLL